jgi:type IV pilus assembly protein PilB
MKLFVQETGPCFGPVSCLYELYARIRCRPPNSTGLTAGKWSRQEVVLTKHLRLGEILKQAGIIDDFQLNSALSYQRHWGGRFGESLIKLGYLTEDKLQNFLARQFDLPQMELLGRKIPEDVLAYIPVKKAREFHVLPVEQMEVNGTMHLVVAMTDPTNHMVTDSLQFMTGCRIKPALASTDAISSAIDLNYIHESDEQEEIDFSLEDLLELPSQAPISPAPSPVASLAVKPVVNSAAKTVGVAQDNLPGSAVKKLENRYENLVRILLDRGVIDFKDLDELM